MNELFHILANEGKAITMLRNAYASKGIFHSAYRIEVEIKFRKLKEKFFKQ
jgi:hypothetical protein